MMLGPMETDDLIYVVVLILSLFFGTVVKLTADPWQRQVLCCLAGCLIVAFVCRLDGLHSLLTAFVNCIIISCFRPSICHVVSFVWCFGYIAFFRTTMYFGLPPVAPHANAVQLILTLKMVGLGFEIHDMWQIHKQQEQENEERMSRTLQQLHNQQNFIRPTFASMFMYSFCYVGLLAGPYYKYKTYNDMIHNSDSRRIKTFSIMMERLKWLPVLIIGFLATSTYYSIQYVRTDEFYEQSSLLYRIYYMVPIFAIFRMRFYIGWLLSECICISATLGAYPATSLPKCGHGPTVFDSAGNRDRRSPSSVVYDFETIHNIDIYGCELAPTVRAGMRSWNMTVQYWLASNLYHRIPAKSKPIRVALTMMVSAFWHGVHPGYYLSFLTIPLNLFAEDEMIVAFKEGASDRQRTVFDWFCWFFKMRSFEYMCMGFLLLNLNDTLRYWKSIYFMWHVVIIVCIVIGTIAKRSKLRVAVDRNE